MYSNGPNNIFSLSCDHTLGFSVCPIAEKGSRVNGVGGEPDERSEGSL